MATVINVLYNLEYKEFYFSKDNRIFRTANKTKLIDALENENFNCGLYHNDPYYKKPRYSFNDICYETLIDWSE